MLDITGRLEQCEIVLNENQQETIARSATQYMNALERNIPDRFPTKIINVLEDFHIFNAGMVPEEESGKFKVVGNKEAQIFKNHYCKDNTEKNKGPKNKWDDFKYEMVKFKKKWINFSHSSRTTKLN